MFKVEKGIPLPPPREPRGRFPLRDMEVGDSFTVKGEDMPAVRAAASSAKVGRFSIRKTDSGYRCWRVG